MLGSLIRKAGKVAAEPELRQWLLRRAIGLEPGAAPFTPHRPPYLDQNLADLLGKSSDGFLDGLADLDLPPPQGRLALDLPGETVTVDSQDAKALFSRHYDDLETFFAAHRFAWVPLTDNLDPAWVNLIWRAWMDQAEIEPDGLHWNAYTATERACNLIDWAGAYGLPDKARSLACLENHIAKIFSTLEYFGEHDCGNHLCNNGRGLFRLGFALGNEAAVRAGFDILIYEAERRFCSKGFLIEGSTHYHLLYIRNYLDCWLTAERAKFWGRNHLKRAARRLLRAARWLGVTDKSVLIGDISPDSPPEFVWDLCQEEPLLGGEAGGWLGQRSAEDRRKIADLYRSIFEPSEQPVGWFSRKLADWQIFGQAHPQGLPIMPGHAHQDMAGFQAHLDDLIVICDLGRGRYGEEGEAAFGRSAEAHATLTVNGRAPSPGNKPYYSNAYRHRIAGGLPRVEAEGDQLTLTHYGFMRLKGVGRHLRTWSRDGDNLVIEDSLEGQGRVEICRYLHTPMEIDDQGDWINGHLRLRLQADGAVTTRPARQWTGYGRSVSATTFEIRQTVTLPWQGRLVLEVV
ncbi:MAG: heparinase II/III domain-containing protein [Magnetovibrionaceae bacterium]